MLQARASIPCSEPQKVLDTLLTAIAVHMQSVDRRSAIEAYSGYDREMRFLALAESIEVTISTPDLTLMNQLKYSVSGLLDFHFKSKIDPVVWEGGEEGDTLPQGLQCLDVKRVERISPGFRRIWFGGEDVSNYDTLGNIHSRLLFKQGRGAPLEWPKITPQGAIRWPEGASKLDTRVYTIRHVDLDANELAVDFFLGEHSGPATNWARGAEIGDKVGFIGPAAHGNIQADFTIYIGDETGLPGIARCLEASTPEAKGLALLLVKNPDDRVRLKAPDGYELRWIAAHSLAEHLQNLKLPVDASDCALWCGAEYSDFKIAKRFATEHGIAKDNTVAFAHWRTGMNEPEIAAAGSQSVT